jgi:hypothetical protein
MYEQFLTQASADGASEAFWGLAGAVIGGGMALFGSYWVSKGQLRAQLARRNRIEVYEPVLRELRRMESVLERRRFPDVVVIEAPSSAIARSRANRRMSLLDVSWWKRETDGGAHLRIAPSVASRLDDVVAAAAEYRKAKADFTQTVKTRLSEETSTRKDVLKERFGDDAGKLFLEERLSLVARFLKGERQGAIDHLASFFEDPVLAKSIVEELIEHSDCQQTRNTAAKIELLCGKAAAVIENQIRSILKRYEKRNEEV